PLDLDRARHPLGPLLELALDLLGRLGQLLFELVRSLHQLLGARLAGHVARAPARLLGDVRCPRPSWLPAHPVGAAASGAAARRATHRQRLPGPPTGSSTCTTRLSPTSSRPSPTE